jgi:AraC family transcriptional regulator
VAVLDSVPQDMVAKTVDGGRYARFIHCGPVSEIGKTMDYIWGTWLPRSGEEPDRERNDFERYDARFDPATMSGEIEIYLPLKEA